MQFANEARWNEIVAANKDDFYGAGVVNYAERWANLMENYMVVGMTVKDVAEVASHDADVDGITGFMHSMAAKILVYTWAHGEELRQWFNLRNQLGDEG